MGKNLCKAYTVRHERRGPKYPTPTFNNIGCHVKSECCTTNATFDCEVNFFSRYVELNPSHEIPMTQASHCCCPLMISLSNLHALPASRRDMGDDLVVRDGERIPRRSLPEFEEACNLATLFLAARGGTRVSKAPVNIIIDG